MTLQTDLQAAVDKAVAASQVLHDIVNGDATTTVTTEGGGVKSAAKAVKDLEDQFVASDVLAESTAARDKAQAWADEAEDAEVEPGRYSARHWASKAEANSGLPEFHGFRFENGGLVWEHGVTGNWDASAYDAWGIYPAGIAFFLNPNGHLEVTF